MKILIPLVVALVAGCAIAPATTTLVDAVAPRGPIRAGEVMVAWAAAPSLAMVEAAAAVVGGTAGDTVGTRALLKVAPGQEYEACRHLRSQPGIQAAEPNRILRTQHVGTLRFAATRTVTAITSDAAFTLPPVVAGQAVAWGLAAIQADKAWEVTTGDPGIAIAIIDTGVDLEHPDLKPNIDRASSRNFVEPGQLPDDDFGHGTHVAGIAAAVGNAGGAAVGVAFSSRIQALRVLGVDGSGSTWDTVAAIEYAVSKGAAVLNLSLGSPAYSQIEADAIQRAIDAGTLVVAAAGNEAQDGNYIEYPASYPNVVSVAAVSPDSKRAPFSNYNSWVTIAAPGVDIFSTVPTRMAPANPYGYLSGTSMASPMVAGAAALLFVAHPNWTPAQVTQQLKRTARDLTPLNDPVPGYDIFFGSGLLDIGKALGRP